MIFIIGGFFWLVSWLVSSKLKNKFKKYSQIGLSSGLSGREIAENMLRDNDIYDVNVISVTGQLTDHYNPTNKTVNLSKDVYNGRSAAAAAIAAHECGHAVQHATAYSMLQMRSAMVPIQNASSRIINMMFWALLVGSFALPGIIPMDTALLVIVICYAIFTLFAFITLPVEFDASNRALAWVDEHRVVNREEYAIAKDALKWAAMTYVVTAIGSLVTLLYYVWLLLGSRD